MACLTALFFRPDHLRRCHVFGWTLYSAVRYHLPIYLSSIVNVLLVASGFAVRLDRMPGLSSR